MTSRLSRRVGAVAVAATLLVLSGCGTTPTALVRIVDTGGISNASFEPSVLRITAGTEVRWRNSAARVQQITTSQNAEGDAAIPDGAEPWESGPLPSGGTFAVRFDVPGIYVYRGSADDPSMVGTIEVTQR